jgi:hypothetical protein
MLPEWRDGIMRAWQLESGVERHAEAPDTFEIPDQAIRSRLVPGCDAKLMFTLTSSEGPQVERMWVRITGYTDTGYAGVLTNTPRTLDAPITLGDRVEFGPDHIIDALPPENWNPETGEYEDPLRPLPPEPSPTTRNFESDGSGSLR